MVDRRGRGGGASRALLVAVVVGAFGCGGGVAPTGAADGGAGAGGAFCETFSACGGDLVGTWKADRSCAPPASIGGASICAGETYDLTKVSSEITWTFRGDGTASVALATSGTATITSPTPCTQASGATVACADLRAMYERIAFVGAKTTGGACRESGGACSCPVTFEAVPVSGAGTYATSGTTLQLAIAGTSSTAQYCATTTTLKIQGMILGGADGKLAAYAKQ
jgi:hypothetical protein